MSDIDTYGLCEGGIYSQGKEGDVIKDGSQGSEKCYFRISNLSFLQLSTMLCNPETGSRLVVTSGWAWFMMSGE